MAFYFSHLYIRAMEPIINGHCPLEAMINFENFEHVKNVELVEF